VSETSPSLSLLLAWIRQGPTGRPFNLAPPRKWIYDELSAGPPARTVMERIQAYPRIFMETVYETAARQDMRRMHSTYFENQTAVIDSWSDPGAMERWMAQVKKAGAVVIRPKAVNVPDRLQEVIEALRDGWTDRHADVTQPREGWLEEALARIEEGLS
jgi:hypothetical protein